MTTTLVVLVAAVVAFVSNRDAPAQLRRHTVELGPRSFGAVAILAALCVLFALDVAPPAVVALTAAGAMVATGVISMPRAQHAIALPTLLVVAGMIPLSTAIRTTGLADAIAEGLLAVLGDSSPVLMQLGTVLTVVVLGQFISNLATVLIVGRRRSSPRSPPPRT